MKKKLTESDIKDIRKRIESVREHFNLTQEEFASQIGCSVDQYKNNVLPSRNPKSKSILTLLHLINESTGVTMSYLLGKTDIMYATIPQTHESPINFRIHKERVRELYQYLLQSNNEDLVDALHFLLVNMPLQYSESYKNMIVTTFRAAKQLSFLKEPELLNNSSFKMITDNIERHDMYGFKKQLLETQGDELLSQNRKRDALKKYIDSLLVSIEDYNKINTSCPVCNINFYFPADRRVGKKIYTLITEWPNYKSKKLCDYETDVINIVDNFFTTEYKQPNKNGDE